MGGTDSDKPAVGPQGSAENEAPSAEEIERALSLGEIAQLPPNRPKGILGEVAPSLHQPEVFEPDLNAGLSQENDAPVVMLAIVLAYLLFFPLAFLIVWRTRAFSRRSKVVLSVVMALGIVVVAGALALR